MDSAISNAAAPRRGLAWLLSVCLGLAACSSPTEQALKHYEMAQSLFAKGDKANLIKADAEYRTALMIKRTLAPAIYGLAQVAEKQGKLQEQFSYLSQTLEQDPNHFEAQLKIGRMLLAAGQIERAREASDKALILKPDDLGAQVLHAGVLYKSGDKAAGVELVDKVLAKDGGNVEALEFLAGERLDAGDLEAALRHAEQALAAQPGSVPFRAIQIQALEKLGRLDAAETAIRQLVASHPETPGFRNALVGFLLRTGRKDVAEAEFRAAARKPGDLQAKLELVRFVFSTKGDAAARQELEGMTRQEPGNAELQFALADLYQAANQRAEAEKLVRAVMARAGDAPDGLKAKAILAGYLLQDGKKAAALALAREVLDQDKRNQPALLVRATAAIEARRLDDAIGDLRDVLRDAPDSARALGLLGKAHEMQGALDLAEDQYAHAAQAGRPDPVYGMAYAEFLMRRGQFARAEKLLGEMLSAKPGHLPLLNLLVQLKNSQGDWEGARQAMAEIRRLGG